MSLGAFLHIPVQMRQSIRSGAIWRIIHILRHGVKSTSSGASAGYPFKADSLILHKSTVLFMNSTSHGAYSDTRWNSVHNQTRVN